MGVAVDLDPIPAWEWPKLLHDLVSRYGSHAVYDIGMKVLGFPATWVGLASELHAIKQALVSQSH